MMAGLLHLWNKWEVQILILVSFALQVFLLVFAGMRRRNNISRVLRILLWLVYQLADSIAIYTLGHMSISCKPSEDQQLMAFWAPFLLVHLGGQDTITAYTIEDNQLWLRHLLTFVVQALGVAYVMSKNIGSHGPWVKVAFLMFLVGVLKNVERVWALSSSRLESISKFLDDVDFKEKAGPYPVDGQLVDEERLDLQGTEEGLDTEMVLQGAHDLLYICIGQFVDFKVWPSKFECSALKIFNNKDSMYELVEMQLSLMYDIFYTKAAVLHTGWGCYICVVSLCSTVTALFLFLFTTGKSGYTRVDATITYILIGGASLLEMASVLRALMSTWTCAILQARRWDRLHSMILSLRHCVKARGTNRKWSGSVGQYNLVDSIISGSPGSNLSLISTGTKELVLKEIFKMVGVCEGKEDLLRTYRGQRALKRLGWIMEVLNPSTSFDESVVTWHYATDLFLFSVQEHGNAGPVVKATKALSNYMMFLLVEHPDMLPGRVRPRLYHNARQELMGQDGNYMREMSRNVEKGNYSKFPPTLVPGAMLAARLLDQSFRGSKKKDSMPEVLEVVLGVWVEMLCYAAHNCSRDSHARQLNNGGEFITVVWLLTTAAFNHIYCDEDWFKEATKKFFKPPSRSRRLSFRRGRIISYNRPRALLF